MQGSGSQFSYRNSLRDASLMAYTHIKPIVQTAERRNTQKRKNIICHACMRTIKYKEQILQVVCSMSLLCAMMLMKRKCDG